MRRLVKVKLNQQEFDALVSFTFNVGGGGLAESSALRGELNHGHRLAVPGLLLLWNKAGGRELAGLTSRRQAEGRLFAKGAYR